MPQAQIFQHTPLRNPDHEFRVVEIVEAQHDSDTQCNVLTIPLASVKHHYKALSYLWGPETPNYTIQLDGKPFTVRENLWRFLHQAQVRFCNEPIFIDAICIDQKNIHERNKQVQLMGKIYTHADLVLSWLGEGDEDVDAALPLIKDIAGMSTHNLKHFYDGYQRRERQAVWKSVYVLKDLRYWMRVWIVQEVLKPRLILLLYGKHEMHWKVLQTFFSRVHETDPCPAPLPEELFSSRIARFVQSRDVPIQNGHSLGTMWDVLMTYGTSLCSEKRDHVFALLSLGAGGDQLKVDYGISMPDLFMETLRLWGASNGVNVLILARQLVHRLLPHDLTINETASETFTLKLVEVNRSSGHDLCTEASVCNTRDFSITYTSAPGNQDGKAYTDVQIAGAHFTASARLIQLGEIKFSKLECTDKILQIGDTCMFLVARQDAGEWRVTGRLVVVVTK
ncbi:hypothetical protein H2198_003594 [Neophaeococcomyces mojaviensis]|uniref:Uncharacterized protein n=1 Tax=Neophaeococcomyces mojaviensis TaxID=3383035 RepID=A0ACC3AB21_9EURO|nr:hypothetical protein H2198_003594 [Knufia sp. JES_112]